MSVPANIPQIVSLKRRVEDVFGTTLQTHNAFIALADSIERALRKEANGRFTVIDSINSGLKPGDSFECCWFQKGRPLYMDRFRRCGSMEETRYVAGERSGLTTLGRI